jgi:hypothetical protein
MSRPALGTTSELEALLTELITEHQRLLKNLIAHQAAMKAFDLPNMDALARQQEASRLRILSLETRRRSAVLQIGRANGLAAEAKIAEIANLFPLRAAALQQQRATLKDLMTQIATRTHVAGKVAGAVLGHLNTVVRLLAGTVEKAGLYTKHGVPQMSARIGVMEAVG